MPLVEVAEAVVLAEVALVLRSSRSLVVLLPTSCAVSSSLVVEVVLGRVVALRVEVEVAVVLRSSRSLVVLLPSSFAVSSSLVVEVVLGRVVVLRVGVEVVVAVVVQVAPVSRAFHPLVPPSSPVRVALDLGLGVQLPEEVGSLVPVERGCRSSSRGSSSSLVLLVVRGLLHQVVLEVLRRVVEVVPVRVVGLPQVVEVVVQALLQVVPVGVGSLVLVEQKCQSSSRGSSSSLVLLVVLGLLVQVVLEVVPLSVLLVLLLRLVVEAVLNRVVELREVVEVVVQVFLLVVPVAGSWVPLLLFVLRWWSSSGPPPLGRSPRGTLRPPRTACSIGKGLGELRRLSSACPPSGRA